MDSCLFCKIAAGEIPCTEVYADDDFLAFRDIAPVAPSHILVIPRRHVARAADLAGDQRDLAGGLLLTGVRVAAAEGLAPDGYRLVINNGEAAGQTVDHIHLHVLGGRPMDWPPG
jgi:histidine triad (HIT) family protein